MTGVDVSFHVESIDNPFESGQLYWKASTVIAGKEHVGYGSIPSHAIAATGIDLAVLMNNAVNEAKSIK